VVGLCAPVFESVAWGELGAFVAFGALVAGAPVLCGLSVGFAVGLAVGLGVEAGSFTSTSTLSDSEYTPSPYVSVAFIEKAEPESTIALKII